MADYAMVSITSPEPDDSLALAYLSSVYAKTGKLENPNQYGAYAYSLQSAGRLEESESVFRKMCDAGMSDNVYYDYWKHRALLTGGDVEQAFPLLLSSMRQSDSISAIAFSVSSANAQREYLESVNRDKDVKIRDQRTTLIIYILVSVIAFLLLLFLLQRRKAKQKEEHERMVAVMDSFEGQVKKLEKEKNKAKFAYLSELYEEVYVKSGGSKDASMEKMYRILRDRISTLDSSPEAQARFEDMLDEESGGIMKSFRRDYPEMSDSDYRMASYIFAGFDNTTIMLLMDISSLENTRTIKSRLKRRIINSSVNDKDTYLRYF
jgi:competence protein ComGC